ncbi:MAG: glycosyltransferase family 2 protein [Methylacidiphilales bacterium]|nr:glycosyltransferase family 2 protein [Candidatus Methylacidiphilales bacterium]
MNDQFLVSIITPMYNGAKHLHTCLDSIINQSYRNIEIICVNDCSSDNSLSIVEKYQEKDPRIHIISNEINQGILYCRRIGVEKAKGEYILFCDCDDWLVTDIIEFCVKQVLAQYADIVHFNVIEVLPDGENRLYRWARPNYNLPPRDLAKGIQTGKVPHGNWGKFIARKILTQALATKLFHVNFKVIYWEDLMFCLVISQFSTQYLASNKIGYYYRRHSASVTGGNYIFNDPKILKYFHSFFQWINVFCRYFSLTFSQIPIFQKSIIKNILKAIQSSAYRFPTQHKNKSSLHLAYFISNQQTWRKEYIPNETTYCQLLPNITVEAIIADKPQWVVLEDGVCLSCKNAATLLLLLSVCNIECWLLTNNNIFHKIKKIFRPDTFMPEYCKNYFSKIIYGRKINAQTIDALANDYNINYQLWPK